LKPDRGARPLVSNAGVNAMRFRLVIGVAVLLSAVLLSGVALVPRAASASVSGPIIGLAGKCIDDSDSGTSNGTAVVLYHCTGTANQNWTIPGDGTIQVFGKCLDIKGSNSTANGTLVELWSCNGGANQQWTPTNGELVNPRSGKCLDVPGSNSADGTQLWTLPGASGGGGGTSGNLLVDPDGNSADCSLSGYEETTVPGWTITQG